MRASFAMVVLDTAAPAQVTGHENGERENTPDVTAPATAAAPERNARIVRIGNAGHVPTSIAHPDMDYENGARLTIRADHMQRNATGERERPSQGCAHGAAADRRTALADVCAGQPQRRRAGARAFNPAPACRATIRNLNSVRLDRIGSGGNDAVGAPSARQTAAHAERAPIPDGDGVYSARVTMQANAAARRFVRAGAAVARRATDQEAYVGQQPETRFSTPVQIDAPFTYDVLYVFVDAAKRANSIDAPKGLAAMPVTGYTGVAGHIAFDDKGGLKEGAIAPRGIAGGGNAVFDVTRGVMTGFILGGTDPSDGAVFASASGGSASIHREAGRFGAVNP